MEALVESAAFVIFVAAQVLAVIAMRPAPVNPGSPTPEVQRLRRATRRGLRVSPA